MGAANILAIIVSRFSPADPLNSTSHSAAHAGFGAIKALEVRCPTAVGWYPQFQCSCEYAFFRTDAVPLDISQHNVVPPPGPCTHEVTRINLAHRDARVVHVGKSDHFGLQVALQKDRLEVYPRLCPHEGGCLDTTSLPTQARVQCPWHGRQFSPIITLPYAQAPTTVVGPLHRFVLTESELRIEPLGAADTHTPA